MAKYEKTPIAGTTDRPGQNIDAAFASFPKMPAPQDGRSLDQVRFSLAAEAILAKKNISVGDGQDPVRALETAYQHGRITLEELFQ